MPAACDPEDADPPENGVLLSSFENLLWDHACTQRLFGFDHLIEIHKRAHERRYGYYVLPFLAGDRVLRKNSRPSPGYSSPIAETPMWFTAAREVSPGYKEVFLHPAHVPLTSTTWRTISMSRMRAYRSSLAAIVTSTNS